MICKILTISALTILIQISVVFANTGVLNVGFDIDDTILFSRDVFLNIPEHKKNPIDYGWVNKQDKKMSVYITPTVTLINYFKSNGHNLFFITARSGEGGKHLANFLSEGLNMKIVKEENLFFCPSEIIDGFKHTTKHHVMKLLELDLFYGDGDSDIIAALKADVYPVRIVRHQKSIDQYGGNYFGNILDVNSEKTPFKIDDLNVFYSKSIGMFGESIYPVIWEAP